MRWAVEAALAYHDTYYHAGISKTMAMLQDQFWHPKLRFIVNEICRSCPLCQCSKAYTSMHQAPMHKTIIKYPYDLVCMDVLTLPRTKRGHVGVVVLVDHASKFLQVYPIKNHNTETIINCLDQYITSSPRCMLALLTDGAPEMSSEKFKEFCEDRDIVHFFSSSYVSRTNGLAEKNCGLVIQHLRFIIDPMENWDLEINKIVAKHNFTINTSTKQSPSHFLLKNPHTIPTDHILPSKITDSWHLGNPHFCPFVLGNEVLLKKHYLGNLATNKLKVRYVGIYKITKVLSDGLIYEIQDIDDTTNLRKNIHYQELRPFIRPDKLLMKFDSFRSQYRSWYIETFGESSFADQVKYNVNKMPNDYYVTIPDHRKSVAKPTSSTEDDDAESSSSDDSYVTLINEEEEERIITILDNQYDDYMKLYNFVGENNIPIIPKIMYQIDLLATIERLREKFCKNIIYTKPKPDGSMPDWGPANQGIPLALRTVACFDQNIFDSLFNFSQYFEQFNLTEDISKREILRTAITYNSLFMLNVLKKEKVENNQ